MCCAITMDHSSEEIHSSSNKSCCLAYTGARLRPLDDWATPVPGLYVQEIKWHYILHSIVASSTSTAHHQQGSIIDQTGRVVEGLLRSHARKALFAPYSPLSVQNVQSAQVVKHRVASARTEVVSPSDHQELCWMPGQACCSVPEPCCRSGAGTIEPFPSKRREVKQVGITMDASYARLCCELNSAKDAKMAVVLHCIRCVTLPLTRRSPRDLGNSPLRLKEVENHDQRGLL
mmetsp:Transcript_48507/g.87482  ORF Transcript_48507/g.87482 Transcript_48507/m.87482 type:complete len:232 (+) Transcript_48507:602-1297(+)